MYIVSVFGTVERLAYLVESAGDAVELRARFLGLCHDLLSLGLCDDALLHQQVQQCLQHDYRIVAADEHHDVLPLSELSLW